jgi:hypothetical protein
MRSLEDCPPTMPDYPTLDGERFVSSTINTIDHPCPTLERIGLLDALKQVEAVLAMNANGKYKGIKWQTKNLEWHDAKAVKHLNASHCGTRLDHETGLSHRAHAACRLLMSLAHELDGSLQAPKAA